MKPDRWVFPHANLPQPSQQEINTREYVNDVFSHIIFFGEETGMRECRNG